METLNYTRTEHGQGKTYTNQCIFAPGLDVIFSREIYQEMDDEPGAAEYRVTRKVSKIQEAWNVAEGRTDLLQDSPPERNRYFSVNFSSPEIRSYDTEKLKSLLDAAQEGNQAKLAEGIENLLG